MAASLRKFLEKLKSWNNDTFRNVFRRKKRLTKRLEGVQHAPSLNAVEGLLKLERRLREEMKEVLFQEEMIWKQKSRMDWLRCGDSNKKFFHTAMLI